MWNGGFVLLELLQNLPNFVRLCLDQITILLGRNHETFNTKHTKSRWYLITKWKLAMHDYVSWNFQSWRFWIFLDANEPSPGRLWLTFIIHCIYNAGKKSTDESNEITALRHHSSVNNKLKKLILPHSANAYVFIYQLLRWGSPEWALKYQFFIHHFP